jgi:hypothetical protein
MTDEEFEAALLELRRLADAVFAASDAVLGETVAVLSRRPASPTIWEKK